MVINKFLIICFLLCFGNKSISEQVFQDNCITEKQAERIIESILENKTVNKYLHTDMRSRIPLKILCNEYIKKDYQIFLNRKRVIITNDQTIKDLLIIRFEKIKCRDNKIQLFFTFRSDIEGVGIYGEIKSIDNEWYIEILKEILI